MARNVAVYEPGAGVVGLEGDDDIAICWEENYVATRWVVQIQRDISGRRGTGGLVENGKVMAVEMDLNLNLSWRVLERTGTLILTGWAPDVDPPEPWIRKKTCKF